MVSRRAIYPGSFDPITNGHVDVVERALRMFDQLVIAVAINEQKKHFLPQHERVSLVLETFANHPLKERIEVASFQGLLVDFAIQQNACAIVRGLRAISDFEFEFQMALMNRKLEPRIDTIFLMPKENYSYLSSRMIKEIALLHGDVSECVPACVERELKAKYGSRR